MEGMFTRTAAINMPGVILSQLLIKTAASNWCASSMISLDAAMISRLGNEYFMPTCP